MKGTTMFNRSKKVAKQFDWPLLIVTILLCLYGLIILRSAVASSYSGDRQLMSQTVATVLGFIGILAVLFLDTDALKKLSIPIYLITIILLVATLLFGHGESLWGARSWLRIGPVNFQPSEFAKLGLLLPFAALLEKLQPRLNHPKTIIVIGIVALLPLFLIMRQPDLGTTIVFTFFLLMMLFYAGLSWWYIIGVVVVALIVAPIVYSNLDTFQQNRILNFLDPTRDPLGSNYQILQGIIAIGSGMLTGRGYMQGTQTQLGFIPEQDTDYIFSVLSEELGFVGGLILIGLYAFMLIRILIIAYRSKDLYGACASIGVAAILFFHIFENIGMTIGLMPVTGIPLPFISYGGTFQLLNLLCIGLVLSISMQRKPLDFNASPNKR